MHITLSQLIEKIREARSKMTTANANKILFGQCEAVIMELAERLHHAEQAKADAPRIVMP